LKGARRLASRSGCGSCRKRRTTGASGASIVGAALCAAVMSGRGKEIAAAVAREFSVEGPIKIKMGPCSVTIGG